MRRLSEQPSYMAAVLQLTQINSAIDATQARIKAIEPQLSEPPTKKDHMTLAGKIIAGDVLSIGRSHLEALQAEHLRLREHLEILQTAQRLQAQEIQTVAAALSREACQSLREQHQALAQRALGKLLEFDAVQEEELELMRALEAHGYETNGFAERIVSPTLGTLATLPDESPLSHRVRELRQYVIRATR